MGKVLDNLVGVRQKVGDGPALFMLSPLTHYSNGYWVSLEIVTANADDSSRSRELHHLQLLEGRCKGCLSSKYVIQFLDIFSHSGPNGDHQCLVFELLGPPVEWVLMDYSACADHPEYTDPGDKLEPGTIMRMSRQLLECVEFIHSAGMAHGGNTLFSPTLCFS